MALKEKIVKFTDSFIKPELVGVDMSERTMKIFKFRKRKRLETEHFGKMEIPKGYIEGGEIKKENELSSLIRSFFREHKPVNSSFIVASLPEEKSFLRMIQMPKVKREEIGNAIRWEIEANIPLPPGDIIFDYEIIEPFEEHADHFDIVINAFPKDLVESYVRVFKGAGLIPYALELESQAIVRAVSGTREKSARIIVDMGRNRSSLMVFAGGAIYYTTTIELGGEVLEQNISRGLKVSPEEARAIKEKIGLDKKAEEGKVFSSLIPAVSALHDELKKIIEYYQGHMSHLHGASSEIGEILLAGGDANLFGLDTYLASSFKLPVRAADPFGALADELAHPIPPMHRREALEFVPAIGLALREFK